MRLWRTCTSVRCTHAIRIGNTFVAIGLSITAANRIILLCANFGDGGANARGICRAAEIADCSAAKLTGFTDVCTAAHQSYAAKPGVSWSLTHRKWWRRDMWLVLMLFCSRDRHSAGRHADCGGQTEDSENRLRHYLSGHQFRRARQFQGLGVIPLLNCPDNFFRAGLTHLRCGKRPRKFQGPSGHFLRAQRRP